MPSFSMKNNRNQGLNEKQPKPGFYNKDLFMIKHMGLDPYFQCLIRNNDSQNYKYYRSALHNKKRFVLQR